MADAFATQAAFCTARVDTGHPVFRGCVDWHSAIHGTWALLAHARLTGEDARAAQARAALDPKALAAETRDLKARPEFETPYGRAWFLTLWAEWRAAGGDGRLDPLATLSADAIAGLYARNTPDPNAPDYDNASWALLNLLRYARATGDTEREALVTALVRAHFMAPEARCDLAGEAHGFMSLCATWAWLVLEAVPRAEFEAWLAAWDPGLAALAPVKPVTAHDYGKNFSRAWGLKALADATGREDLARAYGAHLAAGYKDFERMRGDYMAVGHWVAQFGMLALDPNLTTDRRAAAVDRNRTGERH